MTAGFTRFPRWLPNELLSSSARFLAAASAAGIARPFRFVIVYIFYVTIEVRKTGNEMTSILLSDSHFCWTAKVI